MRSYTPILLLFAFLVGTSSLTYGQVPVPGSCVSGTGERDLDVNNVLARMFTTGSLFFGNATVAGDGYIVPKATATLATPHSPIFASGIWIGGLADGRLRLAGATYANFEYWPGPLNDDGTLPNPGDCSEYDRIWKVSEGDILNFEAGLPASSDLASWPAEIGAPVIAAPDNNFDDDCDGLVDEGTDGIDNDGDGFIDERDEQERVVPECRLAAGLPVYDLAAGDRPEIVGNQALWWVMNDMGNTHNASNTPPIGVEVQVLAWSFARADALNDITFYRYRVIKKTPGDLTQTFFSIFSDPDLGGADDDYVGVDTTLSLAYVYNEADVDAVYGVPPATGYDFFQGPIVDLDGDGNATDTLGVTRFSYFENVAGCVPTSDPCTGEARYNYMQGLWADGVPMTEGGNGYATDGPVTNFAFPGDPVTGIGWSEVNVDGQGGATQSGDRRFLVTTGPFTLRQGEVQDIVFGIVFAQGTDKHDSITQLRLADEIAQTAYDIDFELAAAPPPPPRCNPQSPNPQLRPGSGNCLEAVESDGQAALVWGYPTNSSNYLGRYETLDRLLAGTGVPDSTYNFEAFNIYRYPNANFETNRRELLATYDVVNGVTTVIDTAYVAEVDAFLPFVALRAEDTGIRYSYDLTQLGLTNYTDYYFGITALAFSRYSIPMVIESNATTITVRPSNLQAGRGGSNAPAGVGQLVVGDRSLGVGAGTVTARVVDPTQLTGATYGVEFFQFDTDPSEDEESFETTFRITRDGETVFSGEEVFMTLETAVDSTSLLIRPGDQRIVIDGLEFYQAVPFEIPAQFQTADGDGAADFRGDGAGIVEVSHPDGEVCPRNSPDTGCRFPSYLGGNTVWLSPNSTGDYVITTPGNMRTGPNGIGSNVGVGAPDDFELRFTENCATAGNCLGIYASALPQGTDLIVSVPFELWNVRSAAVGADEDDIRMIPMLRALSGTEPEDNWANSFPATQEVPVTFRERGEDGSIVVTTETLELPVTQRVSWVMPDRPNGYELFEAAARGFGGQGATYLPDEDGDDQVNINPNTGNPCNRQNYYADFCYRGASPNFVAPIGGTAGMLVADLAMDGATPPVGTTVQFVTTPKPDVALGDVLAFDTSELAFESGNLELAREALDLIGVVPNPYMGRSAYETSNLDRVVRFINLPDRVTISIYTVAGTLIRTLEKDGPSRSLDWDLNTHNQLPVASGMYLIHVDAPGVGEKVLKFGVVNRRNRITIF